MPNTKIHIAISRQRTGYGFEKLHKWIDESCQELGVEHRIERN